jgi:hypothetical protein
MKMKTPIRLNSKGNEIVIWCSFDVGSYFLLNSHHYYMCYSHWCSLHHIYANRISNDKVHESTETISSNKNIHLLSDVTREKVRDLPLNMCSIFKNNIYNNILKCVMGCYTFTPTWASKQMLACPTTLTLWKMGNYGMCQTKIGM